MSDGLKMKYHLTKADGRPVDPQGIYFVLKLNSHDAVHGKASRMAARKYAIGISDKFPDLATDLWRLCNMIEQKEAPEP